MNGEIDNKSSGNGADPAPAEAAEPPGAQTLTRFAGAPALRRAAPLFLGAILVLAIVSAGIYFAKRQLNRNPEAVDTLAPTETEAGAAIELPEPEATPLAGDGPPPGKIINSAVDGVKSGAEAIDRATSGVSGSISELPPPPAGGEHGANAALQDAAKDAAKLFAPKSKAPSEIDLSAPEPEAALESLERAASAHSSSAIASSLSSLGGAEMQNLDPSRFKESGEEQTQHTEQQAQEILRLKEELAQIRAAGFPAAHQAKAALSLNAMAEKIRSGGPYRRELEAFSKESKLEIAPALAAGADIGLATLAMLNAEFPSMRDGALAAARRERANGPLSSLGANAAALVRLRPAAPIAGASPEAIFSRAEALLADNDLAGALFELEGLTGAARDFASGWVDKSTERVEAEAALRAMTEALIAAIDAGTG